MHKTILALSLLLVSSLCRGDEPVSKGFWNKAAIGGHDTTAYHLAKVKKQHKQVRGNAKFTVKWNGADWHFASLQSADKFAQNPQHYRPEYNGHCSNALSLGEGLISTSGTVWEFFGNNLHLFYAERGRQRWLKGDWKRYKIEADTAWALLNQ
jgi:YHS domain-containing protein